MEGIILGGGSGKRLSPLTISTNKHFLAIFDKPMIYYSLSILLLANVRKITLICDDNSHDSYFKLLGNGEEFGIHLNYSIQESPEGLPHAIATGLKQFPMSRFMVVLGDNFLYGREFFNKFDGSYFEKNNFIFFQKLKDPTGFGVLEFDEKGILKRVVEKPKVHISNDVAIGIYIFDENFLNYYEKISKSQRGEYEIIDIINLYLKDNLITPFNLGRGMTWLDMGSYDSLITASNYVKTIQEKQDILINSPHEIALRNNWISANDIKSIIKKNKDSQYFYELSKLLNITD